jgi:histone H3/H4
MDNGFNDEISSLGEEIINEVIEDYFVEIRVELKELLKNSMSEEIKEAAKDKFIDAVEQYMRGVIENDNILSED